MQHPWTDTAQDATGSIPVAVQLCWDKIKPTLVTKLGQGSFGQVYEGWYHSAPMAVKIINVDRCSGDIYILSGLLMFICLV